MQAEKRIQRALILHCSSCISKIAWWLEIFYFDIFCHLLKFMGYIGWGPVWVFEKFRVLSLSLSLSLLFYFSFSFFLSLSLGGPFRSGAPGHCPPMPPSRYATGPTKINTEEVFHMFRKWYHAKDSWKIFIIYEEYESKRVPHTKKSNWSIICIPKITVFHAFILEI